MAEHSNVLNPGTERRANSSHTGNQQREQKKKIQNKIKAGSALKNFDPDNNDHNS